MGAESAFNCPVVPAHPDRQTAILTAQFYHSVRSVADLHTEVCATPCFYLCRLCSGLKFCSTPDQQVWQTGSAVAQHAALVSNFGWNQLPHLCSMCHPFSSGERRATAVDGAPCPPSPHNAPLPHPPPPSPHTPRSCPVHICSASEPSVQHR